MIYISNITRPPWEWDF